MNNQQETPARGGNENAKDLMSSLLGTFRDSKSMSKNRRAYLAWVEANGEKETEHITGVFVREVAGREYPVLTVYVDNRMCMIDFLAQREIYRASQSKVWSSQTLNLSWINTIDTLAKKIILQKSKHRVKK